MNVASKMIFVAIGFLACVVAKAQVDCSTSTKLVCLVPYNTGATGEGKPSAIQSTFLFSGPIGSQISQLPLATSAPGAIILSIGGTSEAYYNLGPVLIDRPDSVGQGHLVVGFSAQQFNFNHLNGIPINSIPLAYQEVTTGQTLSQTIHTSVKYNQYVLLATYGLPAKTDISVIVPIIRVSIGAASLNPVLYTVSSDGTVTSQKIPGGYTPGSASGAGDVVLNLKHVLWSSGESERGSIAVGAAGRFPTGDALNYLGSGAYGFNLYGLAAYKARFSPHLKLGYQWNSNSVLIKLAGTGPNYRLPGGGQFAVGVDYKASPHLTVAVDILATQFQNSPAISPEPFALSTTVGTNTLTTNQSVPSVNNVNITFTTANFSGGLKWKPFLKRGLVLYGNVLVQMNDVGLRSNPSPSGGISYNFDANKWSDLLARRPGHW
jgi:hypothetical protein